VDFERLADNRPDAHSRIERGERILNTICISRLSARKFAPRAARKSRPSTRSSPESGSIKRSSMRASVVLPLPDSPTIASVHRRRVRGSHRRQP